MTDDDLRQYIDERAASFEKVDAPLDLGTAVPVENDAFRELVKLPKATTPALTDAAQRATAKVAAHLAAVLGRRDDPNAIPSLQALQAHFEKIEPKNPWTYAVVGQCRLAIQALSAQP